VNRAARAIIDSSALTANLLAARQSSGGAKVMAVIKANAYGHGIVAAAGALRDADAFGVARMEEAAAIRDACIEGRIVLLEGVFHSEQVAAAAAMGVELVVHSPEQIEILEQCGRGHRFRVWLKIDTGMNRLGFPPESAQEVARRLLGCPSVLGPLHLMTHLAKADETSDQMTGRQIECFDAAIDGIEGERSIANSAGLLGWPASHRDWVRPGIMLYGISPFEESSGSDLGLRPAMTLSSELIAVHSVAAGSTVGYGGAWTAPADTRVGVAAIGYGDGYTRHLGNGTPVLVNGRPASVVGRISMDLVTIDLQDAPDARVGDEVVLWGRGLPVERLAKAAGTIPYELVCGVTQRVAMTVV
jgi:alanine racemase